MVFARDWDKWDHEKARSYQERRLRDFLENQVVRFSPYYSKLHKEGKFPVERFRTLDDLKNLPFTSKEDIAPTKENPDQPRKFILQPNPETIKSSLSINRKFSLFKRKLFTGESYKSQLLTEYLPMFFTATTGRTAGQVPFVYSHHDLLRLKESGRRLYQIGKMVPGKDLLLNVFPFAPHLAFWAVYYGSEMSKVPGFHTGGGKVLGTSRILGLISQLKPTAIVGVPGYIYHLLRTASERGIDLSSITLVALGAERTTPGHREKFREFLKAGGAEKVNVLSTYGFTEARMAFIECPGGECKGYHLYPDMGIFEIINPETGEVVPDGNPGEIVFTSLDSRGTVVIRYRTGDYADGGIIHELCPNCGRFVPRLSSNLTRLSNQKELNLTKIKGTKVNLASTDVIIHAFNEIVEWQIEIGKVNDDPLETDTITLYISLKPGTDHSRLIGRIENKFQDVFEFSPNRIILESTEKILERLGMDTEIKEKRIVDRRGEL